jgi:hypothetical protein
MSDVTDLLGRGLTPAESRLLAHYEGLKALLTEPDLAPVVACNVRAAVAALAQAVNSLGLAYEHLHELGV